MPTPVKGVRSKRAVCSSCRHNVVSLCFVGIVLLLTLPFKEDIKPNQGLRFAPIAALEQELRPDLFEQTQRPRAASSTSPTDDGPLRFIVAASVLAAAVLLIKKGPGEVVEKILSPQAKRKHRELQLFFLSEAYTRWTAFTDAHPAMHRVMAFDVIVEELRRSAEYQELTVSERVQLEEIVEHYRRRLIRAEAFGTKKAA